MAAFFEKRSVKLVVCILALLTSLSFYLWGVTLTDNYFWIYRCRFPEEVVMCLLSLMGMKAWLTTFGFTLLSSRILAWLLNVLSVVIPYWFLLKRGERARYIYYFCAALIVMGPGIAKCCTPDGFTALLLSMLIVAFVKFIQNPRKLLPAALLAIFTALLTAMRFPNIVVVPFIAILMVLMMGKGQRKWCYAVSYVAFSLVLYWGVMTLLLGDTNCVARLGESFAKETGNVNGRHTMMGLILRYGKSVLLSLIALFSIGLSCFLSKRYFAEKKRVGFVLAVLLGTVLCYGILGRIGVKLHSWPVCIAPLVCLSLLYVASQSFKGKNHTQAWLCVFLGLVIFVPSAGSDTGFQKSLMSACGIIPIALVLLKDKVRSMAYAHIALTVMLLTSIFMYDDHITDNNAMSSKSKLAGIMLPKWQLESNQKIEDSLKPYYKANHTIFYGLDAHYWYFYTDTPLLYNPGFWMLKDEEVALTKAVKALQSDPQNVLVDFTHSNKDFFLKKGVKLVKETDQFSVYFCSVKN